MRRTSSILILSLGLALVASAASAGNWKKLGTRTVTDRVDHDVIVVGGDEGRFSKLQLRAKNSRVRVRRVVVHFADGSKQTIERNFTVLKGDRSPALDLEGKSRVIRRVEFTYEESSLARKGAVVTLWGGK